MGEEVTSRNPSFFEARAGQAMLLIETAIISGCAAGAVAVIVTRLIEVFGGLVGGVIGTLPTTIVAASIGFWFSLDEAQFQEALYVVPLGMLIDGGVLACWRFFPQILLNRLSSPRTAFLCTLSASLIFWAVMASIVYAFVTYGLQGSVNAVLCAGSPICLSLCFSKVL